MCRHTAVPLSEARAMATDQNVLDCYFEILTEALSDNGLLQRPAQIYNCDETGMPLGATSHKVVTKINSKPCSVTSNDKAQVAVLSCVNAAGTALPPVVIFKRKTLNQELANGEVSGTLYGVSENGWITQQLFKEWFHHHFLAFLLNIRSVLLLMDGHSNYVLQSRDNLNGCCMQSCPVHISTPHNSLDTAPR